MIAGPLVLERCSRRFGSVVALRDATASVAPGERIALAGPNGAGKSTLLRLVAGLAVPSAGRILSAGAPLVRDAAWRAALGYSDHRGLLYDDLTAAENLALAAGLAGALVDLDASLAAVGLTGRGAHRVGGYSRGMRQRLALARALVAHPRLLVLDEPFGALDDRGVQLVQSALAAWGTAADRTLLVASHDLGPLAGLVGRLWVVCRGRIAADVDVRGLGPDALRERFATALVGAESAAA